MRHLESELNDRQLEAVTHVGGPLLVLAGAGSGKTRVITYKIAHLVEDRGYKPWQILAVTFTNKAAAEMRERAHRLLGPEARDVALGTFHSIGLRMLRRHADLVQRTREFVVYDDDDRQRLLARVLKELQIATDAVPVRKVAHWIDDQKHHLRGPDASDLPTTTWLDEKCARIYAAYEEAKRRANAFDFGDLIYRTVRLLREVPPVLSEYSYRWRYLMVDEFQDTDVAQYRLLRLLCGDEANLCVVGDDDQSIYRWRGAHVENILGFPDDFRGRSVHVVRLERNYRSSANILAAANALIACNTSRHEKALWTDRPAGDVLRCCVADTELGEASWVVRRAIERREAGVPLSEIVIFYRTHAQSRVFEDGLRARGIHYVVVGGLKFYERKEVKDILCYIRLVHNPDDDVALSRIIDSPPRGIGQKTVERAAALALAQQCSLYEGLGRLAAGPEAGRSRKAILRFRDMMTALRTVAATEQDAFRVAEAVLAETGYVARLQEEGTHEAETRKENLDELMLSIQAWRARAEDKSLAGFLDHVALLTSLDEADSTTDALTLMTVHAAKGLEFDTVFVTGLEESVFPHFNAKEDAAIEEERRLMYVAVTRGKQQVSLSWGRSRQRFGRTDMNPPSRFISEIPRELRRLENERGLPITAGPAARPRHSALGLMASADPFARGRWTGNAPGRPSPGGRSLDFSDAQVAPDLDGVSLLGRTARHPSFGDGVVANVDGQGPRARITVTFPGFGKKVVVASFLEFPEG